MKTHTLGSSLALALLLAAVACGDDDDSTDAGGPADVEVTQVTEDVGDADETEAAAPAFDEGPCPEPMPTDERFRCGTVTVPVQRGEDGSGTIELAVAVLSPSEPASHADPVVVIDKYEPSVVGYEAFAGLPGAVGRDVVVFDVRGSGHSEPSLTCDEVDHLLSGIDVEPERRAPYLDAISACRERLEGAGVDLAAYTVGAIADDVIDIRRALGYDTWNVIGYGQTSDAMTDAVPAATSSHVVHELMRRDGDAIRSIVLESPLPAQLDPWRTHVENLARAVDVLVTTCQAQGDCAAAYPDLRAAIAASLQDPRSEHQATAAAGDPMTVVFDPAHSSFYLAAGLSAAEVRALMPMALSLPTDQRAPLVAANTAPSDPGNVRPHGLLLSALCPLTGADTMPADRNAPNDLGAVSYGMAVQADSCELWDVAEPDPALDEPVTSDIPTLLLVGEMDVHASPAGARLFASSLTDAHVLEIPGVSSNPLGGSDCVRAIRNAFVDAPDQEPDSSCLASEPPLRFST
jgi:pimeloyl-ACP methyl ester carboxylesterase